jgi:outer membrane biogenesis lipoprotein LolB
VALNGSINWASDERKMHLRVAFSKFFWERPPPCYALRLVNFLTPTMSPVIMVIDPYSDKL